MVPQGSRDDKAAERRLPLFPDAGANQLLYIPIVPFGREGFGQQRPCTSEFPPERNPRPQLKPGPRVSFFSYQLAQDAVLQKHALRQKTQHIAVKSGKAMAAQCLKECHLPLREAPAPAMFQCAQGKACRKPQLQHDIVFPRADAVLLVGRRPGQKLRRALGAEKAPAAKAAVGVRAKAQVVLALSLIHISEPTRP